MQSEDGQHLIRRILRVNHAGEHGAVAIYSAQIAHLGDRDPALAAWLRETLAHERRHRSAFLDAMPARTAKPCRLLAVWNIGGGLLGRLTALLGPLGVMVCTAAVERTVHAHLVDQARFLDRIDPTLAALIRDIQSEEDEHLAYAEARHDGRSGLARLVAFLVSAATETLIALSTRGDSWRLNQALKV